MTRNTWLTRRSALKTGAIATGVAGVGTRSGVAQDDESPSNDQCYYQVDFVAGDPIETLGVSDDAFYGRQNRLIQYVHADGNDVIERDTWINSLDPEIRRCVTAEPIRVSEGTASVKFTVADGCERTFSLAVYPLLAGEFSFINWQGLAAATTDAFGPGTHELTVENIRGTVCPPLSSNGYEQRAKLVADDAAENDYFGSSVTVSDSGETAVVVADTSDDASYDAGSAYVFRRVNGTWTQRAKLIVDDAVEDGSFHSVAVSGSGDTAIVGASVSAPGSAYVFRRANGTWTQRARLVADDGGAGDRFGDSVAVSESGETAVIGASGDHTEARSDTGSAYVFSQTNGTWTQRAKLTADDAGEFDYFGSSVGVSGSGDTAVIGAHRDDTDAGKWSGSAYVFSRANGTWIQQTKLTATDAAEEDYFGGSVAVSDSGETAVVGAYGDSGSAYVFSRVNGTWTPQAKLTADDAAEGDLFGVSVAVSGSGETVVIGANFADTDGGRNSGSAYVFNRANETWTQRAKLIADDAAENDYLGRSVAVSNSGETAVVGANGDDHAGRWSGSAYVFEQ